MLNCVVFDRNRRGVKLRSEEMFLQVSKDKQEYLVEMTDSLSLNEFAKIVDLLLDEFL